MTKIAVVTGAGSGIGAAATRSHDGWTVVLAGRRRAPLDELAAAQLLLDPFPLT